MEEEFTREQLELLNRPPDAKDYDIRSDGRIYLKKDYYFRKANEIFTVGGWSVHHDSASVRYETHLHPKTREPVGVVCYVQTTVTTRFSLPRTVVGFAAVQFGKGNSGIRPEQQIDVYVLALRAAEARGLKDALASFGPAFIVDLDGKKKKPNQQPQPKPEQAVVMAKSSVSVPVSKPAPVPVPSMVSAAAPTASSSDTIPLPVIPGQSWVYPSKTENLLTDYGALYDEAASASDWRQVNSMVRKLLEENTVTQGEVDTYIKPKMEKAASRLKINFKKI